MPTSASNGFSPYELVFNKTHFFDHLRIFGSLCFSTKLNNTDNFFESAKKCILLGYSSEKKGYKLLSLIQIMFLFPKM